MSLFAVSKDLCTKCGACIDECPVRVVSENSDKFPYPAFKADEICIDCGHCVTVCPNGALYHRSMSPNDCPPVRFERSMSTENAEHFFRNRRSIRAYKDKPAGKQKINQLIDIARYAPSGHNSQPVQWLVYYEAADVKRIAGLVVDWMRFMVKEQPATAQEYHFDLIADAWDNGTDRICRNAPHLIIAHGLGGNATSAQACTIALTYLELAAPSFGLGACWAGYLAFAANMWQPLQKELALPEGNKLFGAMMLGYPRHKYYRLMQRKEPVVEWR